MSVVPPKPELRPFEELHPYLEGLLAAKVADAVMVRVDYPDESQRQDALRSLDRAGDRVRECFNMAEGSLVVVVTAEDASDAAELLAPCLQGSGTVAAVVPIR